MSVLLDTHVWIWWLTPESPLPPIERAALDTAAERRETFLSAISLAFPPRFMATRPIE